MLESAVPAPAEIAHSRPVLLFFHSRRCGLSRRTEAQLAHVLQRQCNHRTFDLRRIDVDRHPDVAQRFEVRRTPVMCVVAGRRVVARLEVPRTTRQVGEFLAPWLNRGPVGRPSVVLHTKQTITRATRSC